MQAIILAAGRGSRLQALCGSSPKHMLDIAPDKPLLSYTFDILPTEITEVIFVVNHLKHCIQDFFGDSYKGRSIKYVIQEELNGTGGAVLKCKDLVYEKFIVISGDDIYHPMDIKRVSESESFCMLVHEVKTVEEIRGGVVEVDKKGNVQTIIDYPENPQSKLLNAGLYKLEKSFFNYPLQKVKPDHPEFGLPQTLVTLVKDYPIKTVKSTFWQMVNTPEDLGKARAVFPKLMRDIK